MKYRVTLTEEDYISFNIHYAFHSQTGRQRLMLGRLIPAFVSLCFWLVQLVTGSDRNVLIVEAVLLTAYSVWGYFHYPKTYTKSIRKNILKLKKEGKLPYATEAELELTDTALIETAPTSAHTIEYSTVLDVIDTPEYVFVMFGAVQAIIIPKRCIDDPQQLLDFLKSKTTCKA